MEMSPLHMDCENILKACGYKPSSAKKMTNNYIRSGDIQCTHPTSAQMIEFLHMLKNKQKKQGIHSGYRGPLLDQAISRLQEVASQSGQDEVPAEVEAAEATQADTNLAEPQLLERLSAVFAVDKSIVLKMRRCGNLFSLIDVARMVTGKNQNRV